MLSPKLREALKAHPEHVATKITVEGFKPTLLRYFDEMVNMAGEEAKPRNHFHRFATSLYSAFITAVQKKTLFKDERSIVEIYWEELENMGRGKPPIKEYLVICIYVQLISLALLTVHSEGPHSDDEIFFGQVRNMLEEITDKKLIDSMMYVGWIEFSMEHAEEIIGE